MPRTAKTADKKPPRRAITLGDNALVVADANAAPLPLSERFALTPNGLVIDGDPPFEECATVGQILPVAERCIQFALGDYINYIEERFGESASQIIDYSDGWSEKTCAVYQWLAKRIPPERRRMDRLTIRHHLAVASLAPSLQTKWLRLAAADSEERPWTVQRMVAAMRDSEEAPETFWVLVSAASEEDQVALQEAMTAEGRSCKAMVRRQRRSAN